MANKKGKFSELVKKFFPGFVWLLALTGILALGCKQPTNSNTPPLYSISGVISTDDPEGPARNAVVQLKQKGVISGAPRTTDLNGNYTFSGIQPGDNYTIEVSLAGYETGTIPVFTVSGTVKGKNLTLNKISIFYSVSGTISLDNPAGPAEGALVQLKQNDANIGPPEATGLDGTYTVQNVPPGAGYFIEVSLAGYTTGASALFEINDNVIALDLTLNEIIVPIYEISGIITTDNPGGGASGASVKLMQDGIDTGLAATTGAGGNYTITGVISGAGYTIEVSLAGYFTKTGEPFEVNTDLSGMDLMLAKNLNYSLDGLFVNENDADLTVLDNGWGAYSGKVIKVAPINGTRWNDWEKPIEYDLGDKSGFHKITIFMSVWLEKPFSRMYSGPSEIIWLLENGTGSWSNFCEPVLYVPTDVPTGEWKELVFSEYVNLAGSGTRKIYLDGLNENQGLVDLTLYFRHFKVTVEPVQAADKVIALTFDDGPFLLSPDTARVEPDTISLLDKLKAMEQSTGKNIKVTFFLNGMRIDALDPANDAGLDVNKRAARKAERQAVVRRMVAEGHEVANHSYSHNYLGGTTPYDEQIDVGDIPNITGTKYSVRTWPLTESQIRTEIEDTQDAIQEAVYGRVDYVNDPKISNFFRTPFTANQQTARLKSVAAGLGLPIIYGPGSLDYDSTKSAAEIADIIFDARAPYAVIINHDPRYSPKIIQVLDNVIPRLISDGYSIVTLGEMETLRGKKLTPGVVYESLNPDLP